MADMAARVLSRAAGVADGVGVRGAMFARIAHAMLRSSRPDTTP